MHRAQAKTKKSESKKKKNWTDCKGERNDAKTGTGIHDDYKLVLESEMMKNELRFPMTTSTETISRFVFSLDNCFVHVSKNTSLAGQFCLNGNRPKS